MRRRFFISVHIFFFLLFTLFCLVQANDPDPLRWIAAYGFCAALALLSLSGVAVRVPAAIGSLIFIVGALALMPSFNQSWMKVEEGREAMGLSICAVWCFIAIFINDAVRALRRIP